jgi:hypothetical protein
MPEKKVKLSTILLCVSVVLMICGSALARGAQTSFGKVEVEEISYITSHGAKTVGLLYLPENLSVDKPSPAVIVVHGYTSFNDAVELHAIELSKRGYVVFAPDVYGHGFSGLPTEDDATGASAAKEAARKLVPDERYPYRDLGTYDALQYIGGLPFVDKNKIGMLGHSMGCDASQYGAWRAFKAHETDPSIIVPNALLLTSNSFLREYEVEPLTQYPLNYGVNYGDYDEFSWTMFGIPVASDFIKTKNVEKGMGFAGAKTFEYYSYGNPAPLDRSGAIRTANSHNLRVAYTIHHTHTLMCWTNESAAATLEFFDITLEGGAMQARAPYDQQTWRIKSVGGAGAFIGFFMFIFALGAVLLRTAYFKTIIHPEPASWTTFNAAKDKVIYIVLYVVALLVPVFTYTWSMDNRFHAPYSNMVVPHKWQPSEFFRLVPTNGLLVFNLLLTVFFVLLFVGIYFGIAKKAGGTMESTGLKVSKGDFGKSVLLAAVIFFSSYVALSIVYYFFHVDFGFFKFVVRVFPTWKWTYYWHYLPFFLAYNIVVSVVVNSFTRINGQKEWVNTLLIIVANFGGLFLLQVYDIGMISIQGSRGVPAIPFPFIVPPGMSFAPNLITSIWLYGLLAILPVVGGIHRMFYKLTGRVWTGAILNGLLMTFYAICTAMLAQYPMIQGQIFAAK